MKTIRKVANILVTSESKNISYILLVKKVT